MSASDDSGTPVFPKLARREREILEIIHRLEAPTLSQIIEQMDSPPVRAAVRTHLNVMERKGYVTHTKSGREFVYHATRNRGTEARSLFKGLLANFFDGSLKKALTSHFNDPETRLKSDDIEEITRLLEDLRDSAGKPSAPPPGDR